MRVRDAVLIYQETQSSDKSTKTIDLDIVDPISALCFEFEAVNGTTSNRNNPLHRCITKLEVVDGADVLCSMSFEEAQALQFYKTGKQPMLRLEEYLSVGDMIGCSILFGRYLYDQMYALDLTRFRNPQLKITWDLNKVRDVDAATAFKTGTLKISVWAKILEGMSPPASYLMDKKVDEWTGGSSGDKRRELPLDFVYRMLMFRSYYQGDDINETTTKLKLTCDADKFIAFERYTKQFDSEMAQLFGSCKLWKRAFASHGDTIWLPVNREPQVMMHPATVGHTSHATVCWSGYAVIVCGDADGNPVDDVRQWMMIEGHALHATLPIPLGDLDKPETWFDPAPYRKIELIATEGADAGEQAIIVEQVRPNA